MPQLQSDYTPSAPGWHTPSSCPQDHNSSNASAKQPLTCTPCHNWNKRLEHDEMSAAYQWQKNHFPSMLHVHERLCTHKCSLH